MTKFGLIVFLYILSVMSLQAAIQETNTDTGKRNNDYSTLLNSVIQYPKIAEQLSVMKTAHLKIKQIEFRYGEKEIPENLKQEIANILENNEKLLTGIIKEIGWPTNKLVGADGNKTALLIVDTADYKTQKKVLPLLHKQFLEGNISGQLVASMTDRILINEGHQQRYGTQLAIVNGDIIFNEIEVPDQLDHRRAEMKMLPMKDYILLLKKLYNLD